MRIQVTAFAQALVTGGGGCDGPVRITGRITVDGLTVAQIPDMSVDLNDVADIEAAPIALGGVLVTSEPVPLQEGTQIQLLARAEPGSGAPVVCARIGNVALNAIRLAE